MSIVYSLYNLWHNAYNLWHNANLHHASQCFTAVSNWSPGQNFESSFPADVEHSTPEHLIGPGLVGKSWNMWNWFLGPKERKIDNTIDQMSSLAVSNHLGTVASGLEMVLCTGPFPAPCIVESQKYWPDVVRWIRCLSAFRARLARKNCPPEYESPAKLVVRRSWSEVDAMLHMLHLPWNDKREREGKKKRKNSHRKIWPLDKHWKIEKQEHCRSMNHSTIQVLRDTGKYMKILQGSCDISWKLISVVSSKHSKLIYSSSIVHLSSCLKWRQSLAKSPRRCSAAIFATSGQSSVRSCRR